MSKTDNYEQYQPEIFQRKKLRPWDDPVNFIPSSKVFENESLISKPIGNQIVNPLVNNKETISKPISNQIEDQKSSLVNNKETISKRISKPIGNQFFNNFSNKTALPKINYEDKTKVIKQLCGLQKKALFYIVEECRLNGTLNTMPVTNESLRELLKTDVNSVKTTIHRLVKKGLISRQEGKKGNGGYSIFSISETVRSIIFEIARHLELHNKLSSFSNSYPNQENSFISKQLVNPLVINSNVCSSYINTTNIPEIFQQIDYSPLKDFGFDESHIIQIYREYTKNPEIALTTEIIQNSINALAFDLKHNDVAGSFKNSPTVVLTALLKKGQPYSSKTPHKVLSPREEAMQEYITAQEKRHHKIQELENKTKEFKLQEWLKSLSEKELATFAPKDCCPEGMPEKVYQTSRRKKALTAAKEYFITMLWPQKLSEPENLSTTKPETKLTAE